MPMSAIQLEIRQVASPQHPGSDTSPMCVSRHALPFLGLGAMVLNFPDQAAALMHQAEHTRGAERPPMRTVVTSPTAAATTTAVCQGGSSAGANPAPRTSSGEDVHGSSTEGPKGTQAAAQRPLSSKYRGVCWNRKNRRWQAAINSGGGSWQKKHEMQRPVVLVISACMHALCCTAFTSPPTICLPCTGAPARLASWDQPPFLTLFLMYFQLPYPRQVPLPRILH